MEAPLTFGPDKLFSYSLGEKSEAIAIDNRDYSGHPILRPTRVGNGRYEPVSVTDLFFLPTAHSRAVQFRCYFLRIVSIPVAVAGIAFLSGCVLKSNDAVATYRPLGTRYEITLTGRRGNMAHGPVSSLFRGSSSSSMVILVPRISSEVRGVEIPVEKGGYGYLGQIKFIDDAMIIELSYKNTDDHKLEPTTWNGKYILMAAE